MKFFFIDFLNSVRQDGVNPDSHEDRLDGPGWLVDLLEEYGMSVDVPLEDDDLERLKAFRAWLREVVHRLIAAGDITAAQGRTLNQHLEAVPVRRRLRTTGDGPHLELEPVTRDWDWVMGEIAASLADLLVHHEPERVGICDNELCTWLYYDQSRNRSRRWCDTGSCGNLINVRKHRARTKEDDTG